MDKTVSKKENTAFFFTGCLLGILCFVAIYGVKILNFTYDGWLLRGDFDLMQHYVGWGHFRGSEWSFPIGLISTLSYPYSMSVIYTDSIPMVAVFFKLLSAILPTTFQYFGLYGIVSFALMGGFSMLLVHRFIESRVITVLASIFFIISFPVIQRMYYHTALASQWLIILALVLWVYKDANEKTYKKCLKWGIMGFVCVGIHSYFLPMVGAIMLFSIIDDCIENTKLDVHPLKISICEGVLEIVSFCLLSILNLWILGGFYGGASAIGGGIGTFESNLNTFFNPLGHGIAKRSLPIYYEFQYEGFAYLGMGMLLLLLVVFVGLLGTYIIGGHKLQPVQYFKTHHRKFLMGILFILFVLMAAGPIYTLGSKKLFGIPLPGIIGRVADIFRSNGRFIWVSFYVLMLAIFIMADRIMRKSMKIIVIALALILQIVDLSPDIVSKQDYFNKDIVYTSFWENPTVDKIIQGKDEFIIMDSTSMLMMDSAYYAFKHGMITNCCYYARNIDDKINEKRAEYEQEMMDGNSREDAVYVFKAEDFTAAKYPDLVSYEVGEHVVGVKRK